MKRNLHRIFKLTCDESRADEEFAVLLYTTDSTSVCGVEPGNLNDIYNRVKPFDSTKLFSTDIFYTIYEPTNFVIEIPDTLTDNVVIE